MAYTPELNQEYSAILRRIAWSIESPMTKTLNFILDDVVNRVDKNSVCQNCRDKSSCHECAFKQ